MNAPLPSELAVRWGRLPFIRQYGVSEWRGGCPRCGIEGHKGGDWPDRFVMRIDGSARGWCRRCGYFAFADAKAKVNAAEWERIRAEMVEQEERRKRSAERALKMLREKQMWERYHGEMGEEDRRWWHRQGVSDTFIDYLSLGCCHEWQYWKSGEARIGKTMTLPVWRPKWECMNIRHRIVGAEDGDKYRPEIAGREAALFHTAPDFSIAESVMLVEGEKKAVVTCQTMDMSPTDVTVMGMPGCSLSSGMAGQLREANVERIVLNVDPGVDAMREARRVKERTGAREVRVLRLPMKIDDAILRGLGRNELRRACRSAPRV